jgi:hypothetical protein
VTRDFNSFYEEALAKRGLAPSGSTSAVKKPGDFNQFYNRAVTRNGTSGLPLTTGAGTGAPSTSAYTPDPRLAGDVEEPAEDMDLVSTIFDILSRPVYGTTQVISNVVDEQIDANKNIKAGGNPLAEQVGAFGDTVGHSLFGPDSWANAVFGNDPERKRYGAETIEQSTDKIGEAFDPNYVDRVDNVLPWQKGWAGLGIDVFGDPTMYIPGAVISKPIKVAAKAAYHGVGGAPGLRALGYKSVKGMREYDANMAAYRAEGEARAATQATGEVPPTAGLADDLPTPTDPTGPAPRAGAPGVVQRAAPVAPKNAFGTGTTMLADVLKSGAARVSEFVAKGEARAAEKAAVDMTAPTPNVNTVFREGSLAEQNVQRHTAQARVEAERTRPVAPPEPPVGLEVPAESAPGFDRDFDVDVPPGAPVTSLRDTEPIVVPPPVVKPVPEGAAEALDAVLNTKEHVRAIKGTGINVPLIGPQAKTVKELSRSDMPTKNIEDLLNREHIDHVVGLSDAGLTHLTAPQKAMVAKAAKKEGITPEEYINGGQKTKLLEDDVLYDLYDEAAVSGETAWTHPGPEREVRDPRHLQPRVRRHPAVRHAPLAVG